MLHPRHLLSPSPLVDALPFAGRLRGLIVSMVDEIFTADDTRAIDFTRPRGDLGLFGPDSVCWRVHADFTSMMAGGVGALLLQMLHPLALAGVVDHSSFRHDILGRLRRTALFVAGTTYGNRRDAERLIERVRKIHSHVKGTAPDGRAYAADNPTLLTWVHVAEMSCFLQGYLRYVDPSLSRAEQDRYYDEVALVAEMLGARDVPRSVAAVDAYLERMRPSLAVSERTREVAQLLLNVAAPNPTARRFGPVFFVAGMDLLPLWAQRLHGWDTLASARRPLVELTLRSVGGVLRWAIRDGSAARAQKRFAG